MALPQLGGRVRFKALKYEPHGLGVFIQLLDYDDQAAFVLGTQYALNFAIFRFSPLDTHTIQYGKVLRVDTHNHFVDVQRLGVSQQGELEHAARGGQAA